MILKTPNTHPAVGNPDVILKSMQYEKDAGAAYGDHIHNTAAICNTSASHTHGNVLGTVEKYLVDLFPKGLFKTITASTTLASRQLTHLPRQLHKKEPPIMVLVPRIMFGQDDNRFLAHTLFNSRFTNTHNIWGEGSLLELARDNPRRLWIHGHYNRAVMYVDVVLSFHTYSEQTNYLSYIYNMIPVGHNQFVKAPLELYIPEEFCRLLSEVAHVPIIENESVHTFLTYMNSIWHHPITYKLKGGSNSDEFFMYYIADIDTVIQDPTAGPGVKDGQIKRQFDISFTMRCEFNTIGYFTLNSPEFKNSTHIIPKENLAIVPIFSDVINLDDFQLPVGWSILGWPIFKLQLKEDGKPENTISIDNILNTSLRAVIDHHLKFGIPMERFVKIQFRENGQVLNNELFFIDWSRRTLTLTNPDSHRTYRLIITASHEYVNNLIKELYNLE
jgi:hypothetical protein